MPGLTLRLDVRLKAVPERSGELAEILSQASGPAVSPWGFAVSNLVGLRGVKLWGFAILVIRAVSNFVFGCT
jgi:hypothetical protein